MARNITQYDLLISCPSDVKEELNVIKETVEEFNRLFGEPNNAQIVIKHWSKNSFPQSGGHPQELLNKQFVLDCDAAVAVFWTRFGTPTDQYGSGTEEEIEELIKSGKQVFLYFSDCHIAPSSLNQEQYQKIKDFRTKYESRGIYGTYTNIDEFKKSFLNHLTLYFVALLNKGGYEEPTKHNLCIKGVSSKNIVEQYTLYKREYVESEYLLKKADSIFNLVNQVKNIKLQKNVLNIEDEKSIEVAHNKVSPRLENSIKNLPSIFKTDDVVISAKEREIILNFVNAHYIELQEDEFFCVGNLKRRENPFGNGIINQGPNYSLIGTDYEKEKYELINSLYYSIIKYNQYEKYFTELTSKYHLNLALSNLGNAFDEDIDVKLYFEKGILCKIEDIPLPGENILESVTDVVEYIFRMEKSSNITEYNGYPDYIPNTSYSAIYGLISTIKEQETKYRETINDTFCYEYFNENENDVISFNISYLKQNTNILFPSIILLNKKTSEIKYEITSKHSPILIEGSLPLITKN